MQEKQSPELLFMADSAAATLAQTVEHRRATEQLQAQQNKFRQGQFAAAAAVQAAIVVQEENTAKQERLEATIAAQKLCIEKHEAKATYTGSYIYRMEQRIENLEQSVQDLRTENAHALKRKNVWKAHASSRSEELRRVRARLDFERDRYSNTRLDYERERRNHSNLRNLRERQHNEEDAPGANVVHL